MNALKRYIIFLIYIIVFSSSVMRAQLLDTTEASPVIYKNKYLHYLLIPNEKTNAGLLNFNIQYLYMPEVKTFATGGFHLNVGLNIARFFTRKFILGVSADLKFFLGYTKQTFSQEFRNDLNSNFRYFQSSNQDSARAYTLMEAINGTSGYGIKGNNFGNYGICFSPFPDKW